MDWKKTRRGEYHSFTDSEISYIIHPKRNGKFYIKAYLVGGREHLLPFQDFDTIEAAKSWVEDYDEKLAKRRATHEEEPIKF